MSERSQKLLNSLTSLELHEYTKTLPAGSVVRREAWRILAQREAVSDKRMSRYNYWAMVARAGNAVTFEALERGATPPRDMLRAVLNANGVCSAIMSRRTPYKFDGLRVAHCV